MRSITPPLIASLPWRVIAVVSALSLFGTAVLYSAADGAMAPWATPHLLQFVVFLGMALCIRLLKLDLIRSLSFAAYLATLFLLILVEVIGQVGGGSQRWLSFGPITIQPSELMKIAIILALARFYELLPPGYINTSRAVWPALAIMGTPAALILIQPDLDAALILLVAGAVVMFVAGIPIRIFAMAGGAVAIVAPLAYFFLLEEYQQTRLNSFLDPEGDPLGAGYHVIQSKIAIGSGGLFGKGFLNGSQGHLDYLPEHHTDLAFSAMFEEWGLIGGLTLLVAYAWLLKWGFKTAHNARSRFAKLLAIGLTMTIFFYVAMNLLTATGITPVMGVPLPLISHGGSAMMTIMIAIGLLMAVERGEKDRRRF
ncbi:rod shape-determining protein RodA [Altererythrobacter sp. SALINAS58]|uniref:rod shape-determining protein RodA n=1 Tax=Alteripontixanthobacter muriae TaxID=2705546 RepID=UPI001575B962|nr:rod shape-determining protein RodA [Alteripontixanthobacter muriae]NTZ42111.1 rod shape-determining protein RodA [Alteripontixanthobacter muriae]